MSDMAHYRKYDQILHQLGYDAVCKLIPASEFEVATAIEQGDHALNTIALPRWDRAAGYHAQEMSDDERAEHKMPFSVAIPDVLRNRIQRSPDATPTHLSLGERVCLLKHAAKVRYERRAT